MTTTTATPFYVGEGSALLLPNRYRDHPVQVKRNHAGVIILVHGVNDVGVSYAAQDAGLCAGLNDRLDRPDLFPNEFRLPKSDDEVVADPDAVFYQRVANDRTNSPVIPFHWGYRASKDEAAKEQVYGQNVDLYGNRLDARFAKMGGMFANATSNIPDMFGGHFTQGKAALLADKYVMDVAHSLKTCPDRQYMALAAKRLAALITQIRKINRNETITLIGHSQGCLVSLCAQAFLHQDGGALGYADCLIMNHPPYGLHEPALERLDTGSAQQTTEARIQTLVNLVKLMTGTPHPLPAFDLLAPSHKNSLGRTGQAWTPTQGRRPQGPGSANRDAQGKNNLGNAKQGIAFPERDNRGKVYLYFCPHDMTVGLANVQGIGTFGVPDTLEVERETKPREVGAPAASVKMPLPVLSQLGDRFKQRVWTWRERGPGGQVGQAIGPHCLRDPGEPGMPLGGTARAAIHVGETRRITGEPLTPPLKPNLHYGENSGAAKPANAQAAKKAGGPEYTGKQNMDPIDACDALVKGGLAGQVNEKAARQHYQDTGTFDNSYHSAIVANPEHHRWVTAMDVAIGQAWCMDDPEWQKLLLAMADWRTNWTLKQKDLAYYDQLDPKVRELVMATFKYYKSGEFPRHLVPKAPPAPIVSQTRQQRVKGGRV